jgi:sterol desaturase/sphingolipid hydroxylase (fatty acid hydroxylase superfamily)
MVPIFPITLLIGTLIYLPGYLGAKWYKQYEWKPEAKKEWEKEDWPAMKKRTLYYMFLDYFVVIPLYICGGMLISGPKMRMEGFPSHYEIISTFFFLLVIDDFLFMWVHRLMHEVPSIYKYHKLHHEYKTVASYTALYFHPVEELFNLIVSNVPFSSWGRSSSCSWMYTSLPGLSGRSSSCSAVRRFTVGTSSRGRPTGSFLFTTRHRTITSTIRSTWATMPVISMS